MRDALIEHVGGSSLPTSFSSAASVAWGWAHTRRRSALALATTAALSMTEQTANTCSTIEDPQACLNNDACSWCAESANRGCRGELETLVEAVVFVCGFGARG